MARTAPKPRQAGAGRPKTKPAPRTDDVRDVAAPIAVAVVRDTFKVNVDFPMDLLRRIDAEADRIGIARQAWIKLRLTDLLDNGRSTGSAEHDAPSAA